MVYKFFDKKSQGRGRPLFSALQLASNKENIQLADELHKPIIRKLKKRGCIRHLETISGALI